ncbi:DUF3099 domain-containing protein [Rothia nasimurium]|uniref:DUF3099 domain-containing protein n=1 Tax=Rothia nasimurium TaxID=85336 RepID=UPI002DD6AF32|nr:DUF3099 domain-containing protein [Rothia nasimurium]
MVQKYWTAEDLKAAGYSSGDSEVFEITDAAERQSVGVSSRAKVYAFKMFLRIVFIIAAVMVDGVWQWVCLAAAAIIPWTAVVVANGEAKQGGGGFSAMLPPEQQAAIEAAQADRAARAAAASGRDTEGADAGWPAGSRTQASTHPADSATEGSDEPVIIDGEVVFDEDGKE